jgi:hypothetical protein
VRVCLFGVAVNCMPTSREDANNDPQPMIPEASIRSSRLD